MKLIDILDATPIPIGYRLAFLTNFWREPLLRRMEREFGLIRPELTVLICLNFKPGSNARDICEITEQMSNTVSRAVVSLADSGFIKRSKDNEDARKIRLTLTAKGQRLHDQVMESFIEAEEVVLQNLTEEEITQLTGLLDKLARTVPTWSLNPVFRTERSRSSS